MGLGALAAAAGWSRYRGHAYDLGAGLPEAVPAAPPRSEGMPLRAFGATGLRVSEVSFGAWALGGTAYGTVSRAESLAALSRAEELGCNLVDTAMVYGNSEEVLGEFLRGRRAHWLVATKYSFQAPGLTRTLESQLRRLGTDVIDFYQLHSLPANPALYEELYRAKRDGKVRFVGASVYTAGDIDQVLGRTQLDGIQVPFSLLDPLPFLARARQLRARGIAVLIRSALKEGFLTGKFARDARFPDPNDQRHRWSRAQIEKTVDAANGFRFLAASQGSLTRAAVAYPLSFPEVSSVLLGTKTARQADENFGAIPGARLTSEQLREVLRLQDEADVAARRTWRGALKALLGRN